MKNFFRNIIPFVARMIPVPAFSEITFYRHKEGRFLYYLMSEQHIQDQRKFFELFPKAIRISQTEFDAIHFFRPDIEIVEVADEAIQAMIEDDDEMQAQEEILRQTVEEIRVDDEKYLKEHSGNYADDDFEESEDKNINDD